MISWSEKDDSRTQTVTRNLLTWRFVSLKGHAAEAVCVEVWW